MSSVIFNGPAGRLEGDYQHALRADAPIALVLHPHPRLGGTMHMHVVRGLFDLMGQMGFAVLRFNFRGVGRSEGVFDNGPGELADATAALDWLQEYHPNPFQCYVLGYSFGAWIGMQLLMRRPEVDGFVSIALPANLYDFTFLAPCPASGLILQGSKDKIANPEDVEKLAAHLTSQGVVTITHQVLEGANHTFDGQTRDMLQEVRDYLRGRLRQEEEKVVRDPRRP